MTSPMIKPTREARTYRNFLEKMREVDEAWRHYGPRRASDKVYALSLMATRILRPLKKQSASTYQSCIREITEYQRVLASILRRKKELDKLESIQDIPEPKILTNVL